MPPEKAHEVTFGLLHWMLKIPFSQRLFKFLFWVDDPFDFLGLKFPNRVGLAAGLDKNASFLPELMAMGFGHVEIGTVTPKPQPGNDPPRLFRLTRDECLINRMGFNNEGVDVIAKRLENRPKGLIVGGNIGKNKLTPNEDAVSDYLICLHKLYDVVDYFVVNVSSPNTPNLRKLQDKDPLLKILSALVNSRVELIKSGKAFKPILLKIAPDLSDSQILDVIQIVFQSGIDGLVATNTTISRAGLVTPDTVIQSIGAGGLSGKVLQQRATEVVKQIARESEGKIPIIGVGGIHDSESALEKIHAGANLIQLYTGFIYGGAGLVKKCALAIKMAGSK